MYNLYPSESDIPAALGRLSYLSDEELKEFLNDDSKLEEIVKESRQVKEMEAQKETVIASNRSLAEFNLSRESEFNRKKERLVHLSAQGSELCAEFKNKVSEFKEKSEGMTVDTLDAVLETGAGEVEQETENIAEKFLNGDLSPDEFLEQFLPRRTTMHLRKVKLEKLVEIRKSSRENKASKNVPVAEEATAPPYCPYPLIDTNAPYLFNCG